MRAEIGYAVAGRKARAQVVNAIRLIQIVFVAAREGAAHGVEIQIDRELVSRMEIQVGLEHVARRLRNLIARNNRDVPFETQARRRSCCCCWPPSTCVLWNVGVEERVIAAQRKPAIVAAQADLCALAPGLAEIHEVAEPGLLRRDEKDIVGVFARGTIRRSISVCFRRRCGCRLRRFCATTCFSGGSATSALGRLQGWVGIGAAEFDRSRRAIGLAVAEIDAGQAHWRVDQAGRRIEAIECVVSVERTARRIGAGQAVNVLDAGVVISARDRDSQRLSRRCIVSVA